MTDERGPRRYRWQALLQAASDSLFALDRRHRILYFNPSLERLTGLPQDLARGLSCRRPKPLNSDAPLEDRVAHLLTPPEKAREGTACRERRKLGQTWIDLDFLPVRREGGGYLILGRAAALPIVCESHADIPETMLALRCSRLNEYSPGLLGPTSSLLHRQARLAAGLPCPVLICGEPGTGRETFSRIVHQLGPQRERPLASLDCERLPAGAVLRLVLEERGPHGPAAFHLREPGRLPADIQVRIGACLEDGGGPRLFAGVSPGNVLHPSLTASMGVFAVALPSLRDSLSELPRYVERMLSRLNDDGGIVTLGLSSPAWDVLKAHDWPGNLDELFSVLRSARLHSQAAMIDRDDLPLGLRLGSEAPSSPPQVIDLERVLAQAERRMIILALTRAGGNRTRAANLLSLPRTRLLRRIEALGLGGA